MPAYNLQVKLRDPKATEPTKLFLRLYYSNKRFTYYLNEKIHPDLWIKEEQRPVLSNKESKTGKLDPLVISKNGAIQHVINQYKAALEKALNQYAYQGVIPSTSALKADLDKVFKPQEEEEPTVFLLPFIEDIIFKTNAKYNTIKNYKTTKNHLVNYEKETGKRIKIDQVDLDFYDNLVKWFNCKNLSINTVGTNIKNLKVFLTMAFDKGIQVNEDFRKKRFKVMEEIVDTMYLTDQEIRKIMKLDLRQNKKLERVRDLFIIGCFTGLRFSDYNQVKAENVFDHDGKKFLKVRMTKTGDMIVIPLRIEVLDIFSRYDYRLPKVISNQKANEYLKEIGQAADMIELINVTESKGSLHSQTTKFKWKLLTTHTARRSFATNAYLEGVPTISLMKITGHKTERSFLKYIRISQEENAIKMANHPFFIGKLQIAK